jgi:dipeptidyl aminopeptidase/acylaminoacyl peptidase
MHISSHVPGVCAAVVIAAFTAHLAGSPSARRPPAAAKTTNGFELSVDSIMRGPKLVGYPPTGLRWSGDSSRMYFEWRRPGDDETSTWVVGREDGSPRQLSDDERRSAPPENGTWDAAHRRVLFVDHGDIVLLDSVAGTRREITRTTGAESHPRWARHERTVTFLRDNNLFAVPLDSGEIAQLTDIHARKRDSRDTDSQTFIKTEEQSLIAHTRVEAEKKKKAEEKDKAHALPAFELADRQSARDLELSPDGTHVFILIAERSEVAKRPNVPNYVTESSYTEDIPARTFVGDAQEKRLLAVMNLETGKTQWADAGFAGTVTLKPDTTSAREVRWDMPEMSEDGALVVADVRASDNKDRWLAAVDPESGKTRVLDALHDAAWVREIGGRDHPSFGWLPDQKHLWFLSERDGWMHLYSLDATAERPAARQLTQGPWEIDAVCLSPDKTKFYITSTEAHPGERQIYAMAIDGGARTRLTSMTGRSDGEISPDDRTFGIIYSYSTKPPEVYVMPNGPSAAAQQVTTTPTAEWRSHKWADPQLITYKTRDGVDVYARLITPEMVGARRDPAAPAVVFVHGAGYLQNAHKFG